MVVVENIGIIIAGILLAYLVAMIGGIFVVSLSLRLLNYKNKTKPTTAGVTEDLDLKRAGLLIGVVERAIIVTLALINQFGAISFIFLAKSMARFQLLEKRDFAEYYLFGTLTSFFWALLTGLCAQAVYTLFLVP